MNISLIIAVVYIAIANGQEQQFIPELLSPSQPSQSPVKLAFINDFHVDQNYTPSAEKETHKVYSFSQEAQEAFRKIVAT